MSNYSKMLRDPRWQRKRLERLEQSEFSCDCCGDSKSTLHVHHGYYATGVKPWEYENDSLWVLCEDCHDMITERIAVLHRCLGRMHPEHVISLDWRNSATVLWFLHFFTASLALSARRQNQAPLNNPPPEKEHKTEA